MAKKVEKIKKYCGYCNNELLISPCHIKENKNHFCNKEHYNLWMKINLKGEKNPNYNNKWSEEQKNKQREYAKKQMVDPDMRFRVGSGNRGKKFSKERCRNISNGHKGISHPISKEQKIKIGIRSRESFKQPGYLEKMRKTREKNGQWIPLSQKEDIQLYYKDSNWIERMFDRVNQDELSLLKKYGVFNCRTNTKGVVRDHRYSRRSGFKNRVFPEILRHPCNCEIMLNTDNIAKKQARYIDDDSISLDDLFNKITNYQDQWIEQDKCIDLINKYKNGERWKRDE